MAKQSNLKSTASDGVEPSVFRVGIFGCCPRCGQGRLYSSFLKPEDCCSTCRLDFGFIDSGDGPAVFVILIIGFFVTALAMTLQASLNPPIWVHLVLWIPLVLVLSMWGLRFTKGVMIALQYKTKARQGEIGEAN